MEEDVEGGEKESRKRTEAPTTYQQKIKMAKMVSRKKKLGFDEAILSETSYYIKDGLRHVWPYYFTFTSHAKGRWVGSTVFDVFCREFQAEKPEYYEDAICKGKVHVNGEVAGLHTFIKHNDLICHRVHRHEPPITAQPFTIVHMDQELIVINKPPSIPIHPCGRYRHNTVLFILAKEHNLRNLHTVHRLDRLTSGLLILARSLSRAQKLEEEIRERRVSKEYVCRVQGEFPSEPVQCCQPILVFSHKLGLSRVDHEGKPCSTHFTRLSYNGESSIVQCRPKTGRMHQIRVHLQWLGHPILNDPLYSHPVWQSQRRRVDREKDEDEGLKMEAHTEGEEVERKERSWRKPKLEMEIIVNKIIQSKFPASSSNGCGVASSDSVENSTPGEEDGRRREKASVIKNNPCTSTSTNSDGEETKTLHISSPGLLTADKSSCDPDCTECRIVPANPLPSDLIMYLHALSYKGDGWSFSTPIPAWAVPDKM